MLRPVELKLYNIVRGLIERAGTPILRVYVEDRSRANAYTLGRSPDNAMVNATGNSWTCWTTPNRRA